MCRKLIIISYDYAPFISANSFRWTSVAEYLAKSGHQVFVITGWRPNMEREELLNGVHVFRVGEGIFEKMRVSLRSHTNTPNILESQFTSQVPVKNILFGMLKTLHDYTWKNLYWPDFACSWYFPVLKMAQALFAKHSFSYFITASIPFTSHLVGNKLKQLFPEARWVIDISDPFCFNLSNINNKLIYSKLNIATERNIFLNAQAISILTNAQKDKYIEYFPESEFKVRVNPNILSNDVVKINEYCKPIFEVNSNKKLVFLGNLTPGIRTPEGLLELFSALVSKGKINNIELHLFGNHDSCKEGFNFYKRLIGNKIFLHGTVPRSTALQAMNDADFLVNIGNSNPYQEPSKVIEYASTGKPIINIMSIIDDSSASLLAHYPALFNVYYESKDQLVGIISQLILFLESPPVVDRNNLDSWLKPYRIESIVDNYKSMLFNH